MKRFKHLLFLVFALVVACESAEPTPLAQIQPTAIKTATPSPTSTPTNEPSPTETKISPTKTPAPTETPSPTSTNTPIPTETPTPEPTWGFNTWLYELTPEPVSNGGVTVEIRPNEEFTSAQLHITSAEETEQNLNLSTALYPNPDGGFVPFISGEPDVTILDIDKDEINEIVIEAFHHTLRFCVTTQSSS